MKSNKSILNLLFIFTILFFLIGMIHISLAWFGILCFVLPFILVLIYNQKIWCNKLCPRASFFSSILRKLNLNLKAPKWLYTSSTKKIVVTYFIINLFMASMSTIMVSLGRIPPLDYMRFLIFFTVPFQLPQAIDVDVAPWLIHSGYRIYSMMFTSTTIGFILGILFRPRSWCSICPVNTATTQMVKKEITNYI